MPNNPDWDGENTLPYDAIINRAEMESYYREAAQPTEQAGSQEGADDANQN